MVGLRALLVAVVIWPESVPQEFQLIIKAVLVKQSSSPVHQCGKKSMLVLWLVMRTRGECR